jgi:hypothetical protein
VLRAVKDGEIFFYDCLDLVERAEKNFKKSERILKEAVELAKYWESFLRKHGQAEEKDREADL